MYCYYFFISRFYSLMNQQTHICKKNGLLFYETLCLPFTSSPFVNLSQWSIYIFLTNWWFSVLTLLFSWLDSTLTYVLEAMLFWLSIWRASRATFPNFFLYWFWMFYTSNFCSSLFWHKNLYIEFCPSFVKHSDC